jgi:hypothetical protein
MDTDRGKDDNKSNFRYLPEDKSFQDLASCFCSADSATKQKGPSIAEFMVTSSEALKDTDIVQEADIERIFEVDPFDCSAEINNFTNEVAISLTLATELSTEVKAEREAGFVIRYNLFTQRYCDPLFHIVRAATIISVGPVRVEGPVV